MSIGAKAKIGPGVVLHPGVWIGDEVSIGEESVLFGGVKIYPRTVIGKRNRIHAGAVIGTDGFGYLREKSGKVVKVPQLGGVILKDDVELGANAPWIAGRWGTLLLAKILK